jgi:hypothetical protein
MKSYSSIRPLFVFNLLAAALTLAQMGPGAARSAAYDLSTDFSPTSNPSGAWTYGASVTLGGAFTPFTVHQSGNSQNGVPMDFWQFGPFNPAIVHNGTATTAIGDGGQGVYPPGTVLLFPGGGTSYVFAFGVARFTVPAGQSGSYQIQSAVQSYLNGNLSGDCDYHVLDNGAELFGQFLPGNSGTNFSTTLNLAAGDTIDFVVGRGLDGNGDGSGLKIQASLTSVPEPTSLAMIGLGVGALFISRRRK